MILIFVPKHHLVKKNVQNLVGVAAPSNYKDPVKIAEYVQNKHNELLDAATNNPHRIPHLVNITYDIYAFDGTEPEHLGEACGGSKIVNIINDYVDDNMDGEYIGKIKIVAFNADPLVREIKRDCVASSTIVEWWLKPADPIHYLMPSTNFDGLSPSGVKDLFPDIDNKLDFLVKFCSCLYPELIRD